MTGAVSSLGVQKNATRHSATSEAPWVRVLLIAITLGFLTLFLFLPLVIVFSEALAKGAQVYWASITEPAAVHAIKLTLITAAIAVTCNAMLVLYFSTMPYFAT